jgi:rhodanese-related sulfurtransferase
MSQIIIDVREPEEYAASHVAQAINIPPSDLMQGASQLKDVAKDTKLVVYCRTGSRSNVAMQILQQLGFTNLVNGINQQQVEARYPTDT